MPLKHLIASALISSGMILTSAVQAAPQNYQIDAGHTNILFNVNHLGFSDMLGRFGEFAGELMFDTENIENSSVSFNIQTESIDTFHAKRDEHLRSPDFFNSLEFPEMTFTSTAITSTGENTAQLSGDLTLLGVTKAVTLDLTVNKVGANPFSNKQSAGFTATGTIKRSDFGMTYGTPMIGDDIGLRLELEGVL